MTSSNNFFCWLCSFFLKIYQVLSCVSEPNERSEVENPVERKESSEFSVSQLDPQISQQMEEELLQFTDQQLPGNQS